MEFCNCGKLLYSVFNDEILVIVDVFCFFVGVVCCLNGLVVGEYFEGYILMICCDLLGVVVFIVLWNYLLMMVVWKFVLVLVVGNCVVFKLLEIILLIVLKLVELVKDIFLVGVINILFGRGKMVGDLLIGYFKVWMVLLMGFIVIGEYIISYIVLFIKCIYMEFGGKVLVIVFDDVDIEVVVEGVCIFGYYNVG